MFLLKVLDALRKSRVPYALVGGHAVALHGAVRGTLDVDIALRHRERDFIAAEKALRTLGLEPRLPVTAGEVFRFRDEYVRNRNMDAWTFVNPGSPSEIVDIILSEDLSEMKVSQIRVHGRSIRLASVEDLIRMKEKSGRDQDLADIEALRKLS